KVDILEEKVGGEEQVFGGAAGTEDGAVIADSEDHSRAAPAGELPHAFQERGFGGGQIGGEGSGLGARARCPLTSGRRAPTFGPGSRTAAPLAPGPRPRTPSSLVLDHTKAI